MCAKSNEIHTPSGDITNCPLAQILTYKCKNNMCEIVTQGFSCISGQRCRNQRGYVTII